MSETAGVQITVDLRPMVAALRGLSRGELPQTAQAVSDLTLLAQRTWLRAASGEAVAFNGKSFRVRRISGEYARSIADGLQYPADGDPLKGRVTANSPYARIIEEGQAPRDMKPGLLAGKSARTGKDGQRYTIVPFRHGTPGAKTLNAMPKEVYEEAKKLSYSVRTGQYEGLNAGGKPVTRYTYRWGRRLGDLAQGWRSRIFPRGHEYTHATSIYSGMVRMGSRSHSSFMTFRVVSERSPQHSWWHPGVAPKPVSAAVAQTISDQAQRIIRTAFEADLRARLLGEP